MLVRRPRATSAPAGGPGDGGRLDGAFLLERHQYELIPIDHGFALPEALEPPYFEWQHWPQVCVEGMRQGEGSGGVSQRVCQRQGWLCIPGLLVCCHCMLTMPALHP